jgi:ABC-type bacteriocin/lantibiotic exporter with double-glycine peptidase domain
MILETKGIVRSQAEVAEIMGTTEKGTEISTMQNILAAHGFLTERTNDATLEQMQAALLLNQFVIVGYIDPESDTLAHYAIVRDLSESSIILIDPLHGENYTLVRGDFESCWHDDEDNMYGNRMMLTATTER